MIESKPSYALNTIRQIGEIKRQLAIAVAHPAVALPLARRRSRIVAIDGAVLPWLQRRERRRRCPSG